MLEVWLSLDHSRQEPQEPQREALGKERVDLILATFVPEAAEANIANPSTVTMFISTGFSFLFLLTHQFTCITYVICFDIVVQNRRESLHPIWAAYWLCVLGWVSISGCLYYSSTKLEYWSFSTRCLGRLQSCYVQSN